MKTKKLLFILLTLVLFAGTEVRSQVVFYEDFDGVGGSTAGGAGTYSFPSGWFLRNVDNLTPNASVSYVNEAWERREDFSNNSLDSAAFSTSWYAPPASADDWMWTPMITLPSNCVLTWNALAYDASYQDGYEVRIMTGTPPTGGVGALGNQVSNSSVLFSTVAEASVWTSHSINLGSYAGQSVYIAFRNQTNDMFILLIDDVKVEAIVNYDALVSQSGLLSEYTIIPLQQATPIVLNADIKNMGVNPITNVRLIANIYNNTHVLITSDTSTAVASMAPGALLNFNSGTYTPNVTGKLTVEYLPLMDEADQKIQNDTVTLSLNISDTVYARDNGVVSGSLGIGAGNGGFLGQQFTVNTATSIRSVTMYMTRGYTNTKLASVIWNMAGGLPTTVAATTDTLLYPNDSAKLYTLNMSNGPVALLPGDYTVTAVEFDSTLSLGMTSSLFTIGKTWVNWPTSPLGGWAHNEYFGTSFSKAYFIRPNLYSCPTISCGLLPINAGCNSCPTGIVTATTVGGTAPYTYHWSNGATTQNITGLLPDTYTVTVTDSYHCSTANSATVSIFVSIEEENAAGVKIIPNPNTGSFHVIIDHINSNGGKIEIFNVVGESVYSATLMTGESINQTIDLGNIPTGSYYVRLTTDQTVFLKRMIIL